MTNSNPPRKRALPRWMIPALCAVLLLAAVVAAVFWRYLGSLRGPGGQTGRLSLNDYDKILPGVRICGIEVSGLTQDEAAAKVEAALQADAAAQQFTLQLPDQELTLTGYLQRSVPTLAGVVKEAYAHGRDGMSSLEDAMVQAEASPLELEPAVTETIDSSAIDAALAAFTKKLDSRATDAVITQQEDSIELRKGKDGRALDEQSLSRQIVAAVKSGKSSLKAVYTLTRSGERQLRALYETFCTEAVDAHWDSETHSIAPEQEGRRFDLASALKQLEAPDGAQLVIPVVHQAPKITEAMLKERLFADRLGSYDSPHTPIAARTTNLTLACQAIDGTVLNPGEVFSFNDIVGERTAAKGYQNAAIYLDGQTTDSLGGGVCQVASTIYCCALMANLEIVARTEHMYFVDYVPPGQDATVYWGALDFQFRNNTDYPLRIDASVSGGYVHINLQGTNADGSYAKITYEQLSQTPWEDVVKVDETKPADFSQVTTTPYTGRVIQTYRSVYDKDGALLSTRAEAKSTYHKRDRVTTIGKQPDPEPTPGPEPDPDPTPVDPPVTDPCIPIDPEPPEPEEPLIPGDGESAPGSDENGESAPGSGTASAGQTARWPWTADLDAN